MNKLEKPPCKNCISYPICVTKLYSPVLESMYQIYSKVQSKKLKKTRLKTLRQTLVYRLADDCSLLFDYCIISSSFNSGIKCYDMTKIQKVGDFLLSSFIKIMKNKTKKITRINNE